MKKLYSVTVWENGNSWYVANVGKEDYMWWILPRVLDVSPAEYVILLREKYHASYIKFIDYADNENKFLREHDSLLIFSFDTEDDANRLAIDVNKAAKEKRIFFDE